MPKNRITKERPEKKAVVAKSMNTTTGRRRAFHLEFLNAFQKIAWSAFEQHDILFLLGPAGTGKTMLAVAFAVQEILSKSRSKIILTRPTVEAGEKLGFLPGVLEEKIDPYMTPLFDCMDRCVGREGPQREYINRCVEKAPLAYMRGRSQPLDAVVYTPEGPKRMGDIQPGDKVFAVDGQPTEILDVYPQGELDVYRVTFSDGTSSECSADHLWSTMTLNEKRHGKGYSVKKTSEILESLKTKHQVSVADPVCFKNRNLPLDPYLLGVLLGDAHNVSPKVSSAGNRKNQVKVALKKLSLFGLRACDKYVPDMFLYASKDQRLAILRGLMDTDGTISLCKSGNCRVRFSSVSLSLAKNVRFLVHSLGGTARMWKQASYIVDMVIPVNPFMTPRKADKYTEMRPVRLISKIEKVGRKECQCISVAHPKHLYLTDNCLVTHNTFHDSVCIFDEAQNATKVQLKLFLTRFGHNSKVIVTGDPMQSDLPGEVALVDVVRRLEGVPGIGVVQFQASSIVRNPLIAKILEKLGDD